MIHQPSLHTKRLRLRGWRNADRGALAAMHAHPEVMRDYGGPISRADSDAKLNRYAAAVDARRASIHRVAPM